MPVVGAGPHSVLAERISYRFGRSPFLFSGIDFELHPSDVYALTGPSGSGKSTLLSLLAGWTVPSSGALQRNNIKTVSWVFQNPHGVPGRTAEDHVALPLLARGQTHASARMEAREMLALVGLADVASSAFSTLSGGEAQRVMLARGLASSPDLLLVDEPTAQLDRHTAESVNSAIAAIAGLGSIVVVATHDALTRDACTAVIDLASST